VRIDLKDLFVIFDRLRFPPGLVIEIGQTHPGVAIARPESENLTVARLGLIEATQHLVPVGKAGENENVVGANLEIPLPHDDRPLELSPVAEGIPQPAQGEQVRWVAVQHLPVIVLSPARVLQRPQGVPHSGQDVRVGRIESEGLEKDPASILVTGCLQKAMPLFRQFDQVLFRGFLLPPAIG
jgi:hypothetical protein